MLPERQWRADAVVRLLISVFICVYAGSLLSAMVHAARGVSTERAFWLLASGGIAALAGALVLIRLPITRENIARRLGFAMGCFYAGMLLGSFAGQMAQVPSYSVAHMVISALSFQGAVILLTAVFLKEQNAAWSESFGWTIKPGPAIALGVTLGLAFLPVGWLLQMVSGEVLEHFPWLPVKPEEQQAVQTLRMASSFWDKAVLAGTTVLLAPIAEELLFRGVLYKWIHDIGFPKIALWGMSLVFAGIHLNGLTFVPLFLLSVMLTLLYKRTGNLLSAIVAHAAFNATNFALLHFVRKSLETKY